jgi:hypothetical protein
VLEGPGKIFQARFQKRLLIPFKCVQVMKLELKRLFTPLMQQRWEEESTEGILLVDAQKSRIFASEKLV